MTLGPGQASLSEQYLLAVDFLHTPVTEIGNLFISLYIKRFGHLLCAITTNQMGLTNTIHADHCFLKTRINAVIKPHFP